MRRGAAGAAFAALVSSVAGQAQSCLRLTGSTTCSAFNTSLISTDAANVALFPFLRYVNSVTSFDEALSTYVNQGWVTMHYNGVYNCNADLRNTSSYYARYTTSYLCNSVIQNSIRTCGTSAEDSRPLCATSCGEYATSEEIIVSSDLCASRVSTWTDDIRADYTVCGLPSNSTSEECINGAVNEPNLCGFGNNTVGLCNYCRLNNSFNGTDSCCFTSNATGICQDVTLPFFTSLASLFSVSETARQTSRPSSSPSSTGVASAGGGGGGGGGGLSGGAIAGIVIGSVIGGLLVLGLLIFFCVRYRKQREDASNGSMLNRPSPPRQAGDVPSMTYTPSGSAPGYQVLPTGQVVRMSAIQSGDSPQDARRQPAFPQSESPVPRNRISGIIGAGAPVRTSPRSNGSSPGSNEYSSPEGVASGQSEQLANFKDYYSNGDIHPNDRVSVLWAYQPRAGDEFELERGDMLKVVGIWDDGWATGVRVNERADEYDGKDKQRDSGVSNGSTGDESPIIGEIKAFPLVCVCLPDAWKKTVEGDSSTESS